MVDVTFELMISSSSRADDAIYQGISPFGYTGKILTNNLPRLSLITTSTDCCLPLYYTTFTSSAVAAAVYTCATAVLLKYGFANKNYQT